jgi:hypothetical protein
MKDTLMLLMIRIGRLIMGMMVVMGTREMPIRD